MAAIYYRGSQAALLVYDITSMDSFNDIKIWLDELRKNMTGDLVVHVVYVENSSWLLLPFIVS